MSKPKTAREGITIYLPEKALQQIDLLREQAIRDVPGARLSRSAWAQAAVLQRLGNAQPAAESEAPAKGKRRAA